MRRPGHGGEPGRRAVMRLLGLHCVVFGVFVGLFSVAAEWSVAFIGIAVQNARWHSRLVRSFVLLFDTLGALRTIRHRQSLHLAAASAFVVFRAALFFAGERFLKLTTPRALAR